MVQRNWQAGWTGQHGTMRLPHQFFGLKSIALTTAATLALCGDRACKFLWPAVVEDLAGGSLVDRVGNVTAEFLEPFAEQGGQGIGVQRG